MAKCEHCGYDPDTVDKIVSGLINQILTAFMILIVGLIALYILK